LKRIKRVQEQLDSWGVDQLIVDSPIDLYYLTGMELSVGRLVIGREKAELFVDARYIESCQKRSPIPVFLTQGYREGSGFRKQCPFARKKVGFDAFYTSYHHFKELESIGAELVALEEPIVNIRMIKDAEEVALLKDAASLASQGYDYLVDAFKEGMSEEESALLVELFWRQSGGEKLSFSPIIAFGENTSQPHYRSGKRVLKKGDLILVDIGVTKQHYCSDMTRVFAAGSAPEPFQEIYQIVWEAKEAAGRLARPGVSMKELDSAAREWIAKAGYGAFFTHGLGHGVGLEVHELPIVKAISPYGGRLLEEGMVITIEPGIYLPDKGGVRLEDTLVITKTGAETLTLFPIPHTIPLIGC